MPPIWFAIVVMLAVSIVAYDLCNTVKERFKQGLRVQKFHSKDCNVDEGAISPRVQKETKNLPLRRAKFIDGTLGLILAW